MPSRPFVTATQHELPFSQLSWEQFERLCFRLLQIRGYSRIEHLGGSGNEKGRDIVAFDGNTKVAAQCKRVGTFSAADGQREVEKVLALAPTERPDRLLFIVTCNISSTARNNIRRSWGGNLANCEFLTLTELDAEVRANGSILQEFFQLPEYSAPPKERSDSDQERGSQGAVSRAEIKNRDWIVA